MASIQTPPYTPAQGNLEDKESTNGANGTPAPVVGPDGTVIGGTSHTAATNKTGKQDPFAKDSAARQTGPNALAGQVGNKEPYDEHYPDLKKAFEANNIPAPTESQLRMTAAAAQNNPQVQNLVSGVKSSITSGTAVPGIAQYTAAQQGLADPAQAQREQQANFNQQTVDKIGEAKTTDSTAAAMKNGSVSSLIMFVMLQAKKELQLGKQDDLAKMKTYTTISDLMNQHMSDVLTPKQQELQDKTVKAKSKDKDKQTVDLDSPQSFNLDYLGANADGSAKLLADYGKDKDGKANPETQKVTQTQMTSIMQNFQNQLQQVQSRIQREQTSYQGHDSQDSTLSNIITATNKTFADSASAIIRNVQ